MLRKSLDVTPEWLTREVEREKLRSDVALALPINTSHNIQGRLFTFLPLPLTTNFPCHIHGIFSLTDSRQNLRNPSETIMQQTADALAVAWNRLLFDTLIPRTWLALLESIAAGHFSLSVYNCLPPLQDRNTSGDAAYWTSLLRNVVQLAHTSKARIWPLCTGSGDSSQTAMHASLEDAFIAIAQDEEQLCALTDAGLNIVDPPPSSLGGVLTEICPSRALTPQSARPVLARSDRIRRLPQPQKDLIIEFLLGSRDVHQLIGVPVFQLVSGMTAALEAKRAREQEAHVLLDEVAAELFRQVDANAISLHNIPAIARTLLLNHGSKHLNIQPLDSSHCISYILTAQANFCLERAARSLYGIGRWLSMTSSGGAWPWDRTVEWLAKLWGWVETCSFANTLQPHLKKLRLLPTVTGQVRSVEDQVFSHSSAVADDVRDALADLGVSILDPRIPIKFFECQTPRFTKSLSSASDLLAVLGSISSTVSGKAAVILREHLAGCLIDAPRLNEAQKVTLRRLPIHPVLTASAPPSVCRIPDNHSLQCVVDRASITIPLPSLLDTTFIECTANEQYRYLLEKLDYHAASWPLTTERILQLHVSHFTEQGPETRLAVLQYLTKHPLLLTTSMKEQLRFSSIVRVDRGARLLAPKDVVDPASSIADIVPPWDTSAIFADQGINSKITSALASLGLLRQDLDVEYVKARIIHVAQSPQGFELARKLLSTVDRTLFNCSQVRYDRDRAWIPTNDGLRRPQDCRDEIHGPLCNRVMPILNMQLQSTSLRRMLGWDEPIPLDTVIAQFRKILSEPHSPSRSEYLDLLTSEFGRRFKEATTSQLEDIASNPCQVSWVLTSTGELLRPLFAVFDLPGRLRGFGQVSLELARRPGVKEFLELMGCTVSPTNDAVLHQLQEPLLAQSVEQGSQQAIEGCVQLLQALDIPSLTVPQRERLLAPGTDCRLHEIHGLYYNDLGFRAFHLESPSDRIQVHHAMLHNLCVALQIPSLGSLHLQPLELDAENMREDLSTRIGNVLRSYDVEQAFNEFLANAADAGAKKFNIMLDHGGDRRAQPSEVLCPNMAQFCQGPAVIAHNDAEFTMDDIRGICRIGRGGKEDREGTIGRFGLGALSFYHFSEVAMILSGSYLLLLDPSSRYLPEDSRTNSLYPGHLKLFHNLFGFQVEHAHYNGTIIRLALRTETQAASSVLSKRSISTSEVRGMMDRYYAIAARSLFFIEVQDITALEARGTMPTLNWSVTAQREALQPTGNENDRRSLVRLHIDCCGPFAFPRSRQSSWLVVSTTILQEQIPERLRSAFDEHRFQHLNIALAARTSPKAVPTDDHASNFHFFSSLPLPIPTSLPVHLHASFILAADRRNIRWDGDGTLTRDECNHWLLSTALPPLYLRVIELLNLDGPFVSEVPTPWPGNKDRDLDPISKALVDAFYSDHLSVSTQQVFRGVTGRLLEPSKAVIRHTIPRVVKDVLHELHPDTLVELPHAVRSKVLTVPSIPRVSPQYVHDVIASSREQFLVICGKDTSTIPEIAQGLIRYMLLDDPKLSIPSASLHGLPLLPLSDGTLENIEAEGEQADRIYVGSWGSSLTPGRPWPLFSATRFLDPKVDQQLVLDQGWNVFPWDEAAVVALLQERIPESTRREVSETEREWTMAFWRFFDHSPLKQSELLNALNPFPLIPTNDERVFVSLEIATAFPAICLPSLSSEAWLVGPLQQIGVLIINIQPSSMFARVRTTEGLPRIVKDRLLDSIAFTSTRVLQTLHHLNSDGHIETRFGTLSEENRTRLARWLRDSLGHILLLHPKAAKLDFVNVLRSLPIWPAYRGSGVSVLKSLSTSHIRLLPQHAKPACSIVPFLLANPNLYFVEHSEDISCLEVIQPMSMGEFSRLLKFPPFFRTDDMIPRYKPLLDVVIKLGGQEIELSKSLRVPNGNLELITVCSMYKSNVPEFTAAFAHRRGEKFVHPQLSSYEQKLVVFGLRERLTFETFKECVAAIDQDFDEATQPGDLDRCGVIYEWYTTRLPFTVTNSDEWRQLDGYSFIPTRLSRREGVATLFNDTGFALRLPRIVSPRQILRPEYSAIAWTQRALFDGTPDKRLFMADESVGIPAIEEVVKHLHVLATKIAPRHSRDAGLLSDLKGTYKYLQERHGEAARFLLSHRNHARLFLNVDDPETESWEFLPASQIMFNVPDEDDRKEARAFLRPFRELLLASGANEIKIPSAAPIAPSSPEAHLSRFRASFDMQRRTKVLTDVVFRVAGATAAEEDRNHWAHRALLATASRHFYDSFCAQSGFSESRAASVEEPVVIELEDDLEFRCVGLVLDHIYTGQFQESQGRECLLELMRLAHRWELADVQAKAEALLVPTITPGNYHELREHAEEISATGLLEKIEEFERENAFVLGGL
ncbi:hypothetical protein GSI_05323 [Ganoderma sinense ZZ0214-1]|uniref:BTB domain-containing protein n=1 Tax=Ganoderma sinense ZZ0214-1 TaxID=1077348 RepID=A0A2G8SFS7_9APHY|nr:hypothetical protein GSI_05323 [Ganoderma sinense ZZ0214-1]